MIEFKQIIGRGTRVRDDYGKLFFNILDYTGSGHPPVRRPGLRRRARPRSPRRRSTSRARQSPEARDRPRSREDEAAEEQTDDGPGASIDDERGAAPQVLLRRRPGRDRRPPRLRARPRRQAAPRRQVHRLHGREGAHALHQRRPTCAPRWADPKQRADDHRSSWPSAASTSTSWPRRPSQPDADPFDLLCHVAFNAPLRTRRERAERLRKRAEGLLRPVRPRGPGDPGRAAGEVRRARHGAVRRSRTCSRCRRSRARATSLEIASVLRRRREAARGREPVADAAVRGVGGCLTGCPASALACAHTTPAASA